MTDQYFRPRNWDKHQGWRKRGAVWIKNYTALLDDPKYLSLPPFSALVLHRIWMLCGRHGRVLALSSSYLGPLLGVSSQGLGHALKVLVDRDFIELCDKTVALYSQDSPVSIEEKREERDAREENGLEEVEPAPKTEPTQKKLWRETFTLARENDLEDDDVYFAAGKLKSKYGKVDHAMLRELIAEAGMSNDAPAKHLHAVFNGRNW